MLTSCEPRCIARGTANTSTVLAEEARAIAVKEAVESKGTKQKAGAKTTAEAENVSKRTVSFRNDGCRQHAE